MNSLRTGIRSILAVGVFGAALFLAGTPVSAHPSTDVQRGLEALAKGRLEEAEAAFSRARFVTPDDPRILYNLGLVSLQKRSYELGAGYFARAVATSDDAKLDAAAWHNQGNCWYRAGRYQEAVSAYEQSLQLEENAETRHNLEQAKKKLDEMMRKMAENKPPQQGDQQQHQGNQQQQSGQQQQQNGEKQDGQQQAGQQQQQDGQKQGDQDNQQQARQDGKQDENQKGASSPEQQKDDPARQAAKPGEEGDKQTGSDSAQVAEEQQDKPREDLQMAEGGKDKPETPPSQQARAMKNRQMNPYMVEKILRQLEERERELQMHYRNDPQRQDEPTDPFMMDAQQLREWMAGRRPPKPPAPTDAPDW